MALPYFFSAINPEIIVIGAFFFIFFAFINFGLSKVFRDRYGNVNVLTSAIISICISILIIYFGRNVVSNLVEGLRLSSAILYVLSGVGVLVILYLLRKSLRFGMILMLVGAGLILVGALTDFFYQKWFVILFGALMFIIGIASCVKKKPKSPRYSQKEHQTKYRGDYHKYKYKTKELRAKQEYEYHQRLEGRRKVQKRDLEREQRRQTAKEKKLKERYARRFGSRTARKRFKK